MFVRDNHAVGASYQFIVAGAILVVFLGVILLSTQQLGTDDGATTATHNDLRSRALLQVASGNSWAWSEGNKSISGGFGNEQQGFPLANMVHFKGAQWTATGGNERFDYAEARTSWGVAEHDDMHLRIVPITSTGLYDLSSLRVAYIGDWKAIATIYAPIGVGDPATMTNTRAELDQRMESNTVTERSIIAGLGADFDNDVHITAAHPTILIDTTPPLNTSLLPLVSVLSDTSLMEGDVYYDDPDHLGSILKPRLSQYDVVIIGSGVDNNAIKQAQLHKALVNHTTDGGLLIQLGADSSHDWMTELGAAGAETANQGLVSPDVHHPVLEWPFGIAEENFDQSRSFDAAALPDAAFHRVLGTTNDPVLVVSQQGALNDGTAFVTSINVTDDTAQGDDLLTNMFAYYARQDLFLEFGPTIPAGEQVSAATRSVWGDDGGGNKVALRMTMYYWD